MFQLSIDGVADRGEVSVVFKTRRDADSTPPTTPQRTPTHARTRHATAGDRPRAVTSPYAATGVTARHDALFEGQEATLDNVWVRQHFRQFVGVCCFHMWSSMLQ